MAENEILDVGSPRRYRRWRQALADAGVSPSETAECLSAEFQKILRNKLRRYSLYVVLKACKTDRNALREVVATFGDRALAKRVEQACAMTRAESVRRRMTNHLRLTDVPADQDAAIHELQLRHSTEIVKTFGLAFPQPMAALPSENASAEITP